MVTSTLKCPPPETDLGALPIATIGPDTDLYRVSRRGRDPWWFGSELTGRFDLASPRGTCYVSEDEATAVIEVLCRDAGPTVVAQGDIDGRCVRSLTLPDSRHIGDFLDRRVVSFGGSEIGTSADYGCTQTWAAALDDAGTPGLRYRSRLDPQGSAIALFGEAGARRRWRRSRPRSLSRILDEQLGGVIEVAPPPSSADVTIHDSAPAPARDS